MTPETYGLPGLLGADLALLSALRAEGLLRGLPLLEALVQVRRAREYGQAPADLLDALRRHAAARQAQPAGKACPDCHGEAWRPLSTGGRACSNCGFVERGTA